MVKYLEYDEMLIIHARIIDETGGAHGVRDINLVASVIERLRMGFGGKDLYVGLFMKAAAYFESCAFNHMFIDGNKRTAIVLAARFLFLNDYELGVTNKEMEKFVLNAVTKKHSLQEIAAWLKKHSKKIK